MEEQLHRIRLSFVNNDEEERTRERAAKRIQHAWNVHKGSKAKAKYLTPETRWQEATSNAQLELSNMGAEQGRNKARARWRRAGIMTRRLQDGDPMLETAGVVAPNATRKPLETQHWLELIDGKHRYGSNLKFYHRRWKDTDTEENFFKWLDHGGGKDLSLRECPREQLEKERITYLSNEQRLNYLVEIDSDGKLHWARNKMLVDTTAGHWKDAGNGEGIVPEDEPDAPPRPSTNVPSSSTSSRSASSGSLDNAAMHYIGVPKGRNKLMRAFWRNFTIRGLGEKLLRKTVRRNTWIYVSDKNFNIFVGIKDPGTFQHSSFLAGGLVTSAGLISVKDGMIHTLSPLSGHYRTSINHFHQFLDILKERGVNMDKVEVSKAETALWLIEHLGKLKKGQARVVSKGKAKLHKAKEEIEHLPEIISDTDWKKEILEGRKRNKPPNDGAANSSEHIEGQEAKGAKGVPPGDLEEKIVDRAALPGGDGLKERAAGAVDNREKSDVLASNQDAEGRSEGRPVEQFRPPDDKPFTQDHRGESSSSDT